jgi:hypothetical protein
LKLSVLKPVITLPSAIKTINHAIIYYICNASSTCAYRDYKLIISGNIESIQNKRIIPIAKLILNLPPIITFKDLEDIDFIDIQTKMFIRINCFQYQNASFDPVFLNVMARIYKLKYMTSTQATQKMNEWQGNKDVGIMLCYQIYLDSYAK